MKEMIYRVDGKRELLDSGKIFGFEYFIMSLGMYPTAYIKIPEKHPFYKKDYEDIYYECDIDVNGGLTYSEDYLIISKTKKIEGWFIGWDYGHYGDYCAFGGLFDIDGKKWTTEEIRQEVFTACEQLNRMVNKKDD